MNSIILGNGINIQYGGLDYTNKSIVKRAFQKLNIGDFSKKVYPIEVKFWLEYLHKSIPEFLNGKFDKLAVVNNEKEELYNFKKQYSRKSKIYDIGFEDYFLLNELVCRKNKIVNPERFSFQESLRRLFLDSIYNNGKLDLLYKKYSPDFIEYLKRFDNVFTTNYDQNIEKAVGIDVLYLHGAFHVLSDTYDPLSFRNKLSDNPAAKNPAEPGYMHCFSTALTYNSGNLKQFVAMQAEQANLSLEKFSEGLKEKPELRGEIEEWGKSDNILLRNFPESIFLKEKEPSLEVSIDYTLGELGKIKGKVTFIGLSPNNDSHIMNSIRDNKFITEIDYYFFATSEGELISNELGNKQVNVFDVSKFWNKTSP